MAINESSYIGIGSEKGSTVQHEITHLKDIAEYADKIYQLETNDFAIGGPNGILNLPLQGLANRTAYLKKIIDDLRAAQPGTDEYDKLIAEIKSLDLSKSVARINHLERLTANIMLSLEAQNMAPEGYDGMIAETFNDSAEEIDQAVAVVTSVVSGDDSIDVTSAEGIIIGAHYQLTDGEKIEEVQVKSLNVSGSIKRVILVDTVKNQYTDGRAKLYRSSVAIYNGRAYGGGNVRTDEWDENHSFSGSNTSKNVDTTLTFDNADAFIMDGADLDNGKFVLGSAVVGIALISEGGGNGTWKQVDEEGDNL